MNTNLTTAVMSLSVTSVQLKEWYKCTNGWQLSDLMVELLNQVIVTKT